MRALLTLMTVLALCGCASRRNACHVAVADVDSTVVSNIERIGRMGRIALWTARLDADSIHISTPQANIVVYGIRSSTEGADIQKADVSETQADSASVDTRVSESDFLDEQTDTIYKPPDLTLVWVIAIVIAAVAAVIIYLIRRK